jgi:hypothetical protein
MRRKKRTISKSSSVIKWLPFDSRLIPSIFAFGHVTGIARIFLTIEMLLATSVVLGTLTLMIFHLVAGV